MRSHSCRQMPESEPKKADERSLEEIIKRLEEEKLLMASELSLHVQVLKNSAEIINIMTNFYYQAFREIHQRGFNLAQLDTI